MPQDGYLEYHQRICRRKKRDNQDKKILESFHCVIVNKYKYNSHVLHLDDREEIKNKEQPVRNNQQPEKME